MDINELQSKQGWHDHTLSAMALEWIKENGHQQAFTEHLQATADFENDTGMGIDFIDDNGAFEPVALTRGDYQTLRMQGHTKIIGKCSKHGEFRMDSENEPCPACEDQ